MWVILYSYNMKAEIHKVAEPLYTIEPASPAERKKIDKRIKEYEEDPSCFVPYKKRVKSKP